MDVGNITSQSARIPAQGYLPSVMPAGDEGPQESVQIGSLPAADLKVVVIGSPGPHDRRSQFLDAAASQHPDDHTVWVVEPTGYQMNGVTPEDIRRKANGAHVLFMEPEQSVTSVLDRLPNGAIDSMTVFSHGLRGQVALRHGWDDAHPDYGLNLSDVKSLDRAKFTTHASIELDSCNSAVTGIGDRESTAQALADQTGLDVKGWSGRTSFRVINRGGDQVVASRLEAPTTWQNSWDDAKELFSRVVAGAVPQLVTVEPSASGIS